MSSNARVGSLRHVERLESRQMLAGDVAVSVVDGNLLIHGDELANQIALTAGSTPDSFRLFGWDGTAVHVTESTDPAASELLVSGVTGNVVIRLGEGDDVVRIDHAAFPHDVSIATDGGSDQVVLGISPAVAPELTAVANDEQIAPPPPAHGVSVGGSLRVATGADGDTIRIAHAAVRGRLAVFSDGGNDEVAIGQPWQEAVASTAPETPDPAVKAGHAIAIHLGAGDDRLAVGSAASFRGVLVDGGAGSDQIRLNGLQAGYALHVLGGPGEHADTVELHHVRSRNALIHTGDGNDKVAIVGSTFGHLAVALGAGDDTLAMGGLKAGTAVLLGDLGDDTLTLLAANMIGRRIVRGFENLPGEPAPTA